MRPDVRTGFTGFDRGLAHGGETVVKNGWYMGELIGCIYGHGSSS